MSFTIPGKLNIIEKNGRKGVFTVAELITDVGTFDLKNRILEQFQAGTYDGVFVITRIFTMSVTWKSGTWTKLCADLDWECLRILAQSEEPLPSPVAEIVAEATQEETAEVQAAAPEAPHPTHNQAAVQPGMEDALVSEMEMLEQLIQEGKQVKLDSTLDDRNLFRQLRDRLKEAGYRFNGADQSWYCQA